MFLRPKIWGKSGTRRKEPASMARGHVGLLTCHPQRPQLAARGGTGQQEGLFSVLLE